jgi:hypothetical protein
VPLSEIGDRIWQEVDNKGLKLSLVVIDTSAAYFEGSEENSNVELGNHARRMRSLTTLPGNPCVMIICPPTKNATDDQLVPRGGGAFLNEVDGNIAIRMADNIVVANALGKLRGPEFTPIYFELLYNVKHPLLKDTKGREIPTVVALPVNDVHKAIHEAESRRDEDAVLGAVGRSPGTPTDIARACAWMLRDGKPNHMKAKRALDRLKKDKCVMGTNRRTNRSFLAVRLFVFEKNTNRTNMLPLVHVVRQTMIGEGDLWSPPMARTNSPIPRTVLSLGVFVCSFVQDRTTWVCKVSSTSGVSPIFRDQLFPEARGWPTLVSG